MGGPDKSGNYENYKSATTGLGGCGVGRVVLPLLLMNPDYLRAITRPVVTMIIATALSILAVLASFGYDVPQWFLGFGIPIVLWWFGERTTRHIKGKIQ